MKKTAKKSAPVAPTMSASEFIRSRPLTESGSAVIKAGEKLGIKISAPLVYIVRGRMRAKTAAKKAARKNMPLFVTLTPNTKASTDLKLDATPAPSDQTRAFRALVLDIGLTRAEELLTTFKRDATARLGDA